jgi:Ca2+-binding RTX toxin-like protein
LINQSFERTTTMGLISMLPSVKIGTHKADTLNGSSRVDIIFGQNGDDIIYGNGGDDYLFGGNGNDKLFGGSGNDVLSGGQGNDMLSGGTGNDRLYGGVGDDQLTGGTGNDVLFGGAGADKFYFNPNRHGEGHDRIADFDAATDKVVLKVTDVLASTPGLLAESGNPNALEATDLDNSDLWNLSASKDGDLLITHPNGTIEIDAIDFSPALTFADVLPVIELVPPSDMMTI